MRQRGQNVHTIRVDYYTHYDWWEREGRCLRSEKPVPPFVYILVTVHIPIEGAYLGVDSKDTVYKIRNLRIAKIKVPPLMKPPFSYHIMYIKMQLLK